MDEAAAVPVSKVLVLDRYGERQGAIRNLCGAHRLVPVKAAPSRLLSVLRTHVDLGAILCAEDYADSIEATTALAESIRAVRPELPILLSRPASADFSGLPEGTANTFCAAFCTTEPGPLREVVARYIFNLDYPNALVRGIMDLTRDALASQFPGLVVAVATPQIVRDRLLTGDVFTLIPLDSAWCRGYMQLLVDERPVLDWLTSGGRQADFRQVNALLGEATNLVWGGFKNRYIGDAAAQVGTTIQVPIIVNQRQRYISFGTENPQLGFAYTLSNAKQTLFRVSQRFVFNLSWSPEQFREFLSDAADAGDSGELELF